MLKINKNTFVSSSDDKTIKFIELTNNFTTFKIIKSFEIHSLEVNQCIKLKEENLYASCSKEGKIKIWKFALEDNEPQVKYTLINLTGVLSIYELPNLDKISISEDGFLKFWELKENNYDVVKSLKGFLNCYHNCISSINEEIILVGTKKCVYLIDTKSKIKINRFLLSYNSYSIGFFKDSIFLGLKNNDNSCLLFEYNIEQKFEGFNFECFGKGRDLCSEISYIYPIDKTTVITCNKNNYIKIWKITEKKPKLLLIENNPNYNEEEGYDDEEILTPGNDNSNKQMNYITPGNDNSNNQINDNNNFILIENNQGDREENRNINNIDNNIDNEKEENDKMNENDSKLIINFKIDKETFKLLCEKDMTVEQLIILFNEKIDNDKKGINKDSFYYDCEKLDINDKSKIKDKFKNNSFIVVIPSK